MNQARKLRVFLSYASQDKLLVHEFANRLGSENWVDIWLDEESILPGQDWRLKIEEAVENSDIVIICLSNNSVNKEGYIQKEIKYAQEIALEKPDGVIYLIPLKLDECQVPRGLRFYQWVDYFGKKKEDSYKKLLNSLKLRNKQKVHFEEQERRKDQYISEKIINQYEPSIISSANAGVDIQKTPWLKLWFLAFIMPNASLYERILTNRQVNTLIVYIWLFIAGMFMGFSNLLGNLINDIAKGASVPVFNTLISFIFITPFTGIIMIFVYTLVIAILFWSGKLLGGVSTFSNTFFAQSIIYLPFFFIESVLFVLAEIPAIKTDFTIIYSLLTIYFAFLQLLIFKVANKFSWWRAFGSLFISTLILTAIFIVEELILRLYESLGISQ